MTSHWYWINDEYSYVFEFSDGSLWVTEPKTYRWKEQWPIHSRILKIGENSGASFINVDLALQTVTQRVEPKHCLDYFFNLKKIP